MGGDIEGMNTGSDFPRHVLLVEDSMIIALDTEQALLRLGIASVSVAKSVGAALASIAERLPDFAIVDFDLGEETSEPVAHELVRRGVRFVIATGYADMDKVAEQLGAGAVLSKPYAAADLEALFRSTRGCDQ